MVLFADVPVGVLFEADGRVYKRLFTTTKRVWVETAAGRKKREAVWVNGQEVDETGKAVRPAAYRYWWRGQFVDRIL